MLFHVPPLTIPGAHASSSNGMPQTSSVYFVHCPCCRAGKALSGELPCSNARRVTGCRGISCVPAHARMSQNAPLALQGTVKSSANMTCTFSRLSTPGNHFHAGPLPPPGSPVSRKRPGQAAFLLDRQPFTPHPTLSHYACFPGPDLAYLASPGVLWGAVALYVGYVRRPDDGKLGCFSGHTGRHSADGLAGSTGPERRAKQKGTPEECWWITPLFHASFHMASVAASCWLVRPGSGHDIGPCWFGSKLRLGPPSID